MGSWLVALRMARREALRAKGRTALIVVMIGLPVLALAFSAAMFDMQRLTPQDKAVRLMGAADGIVVDSPSRNGTKPQPVWEEEAQAAVSYQDIGEQVGPHEAATILPYLPAGSSATGVWVSNLQVRTAHGLGDLPAQGIDAGSPITKGLYRLLRGRMPRTTDEVAVSPSALTRLGTTVGGTMTIRDGRRFTVVGVAAVSGKMTDSLLFSPSVQIDGAGGYWLVKQPGPMTWAQIQRLNGNGFEAQSRALILHPPKRLEFQDPQQKLAGLSRFRLDAVVVGLGLPEVALLAGPAFAVGARRRQRQLALIAAQGGTPAVLRRMVLADGVVSGLFAGVVGTVLGVALAYGLRGELETHYFHEYLPGHRVNVWWLAGIVAVAVLTGVVGALAPAFTAARQEVVAALAGRRGAQRSRRRWVLLGLGLLAAGVAVAVAGAYRQESTVAVVGLGVAEFGIVLCTPAIVGQIARAGRFLPLTPRIALRDMSRRRGAAAPAISAVMAAVAGSIVLTVYMGATKPRPTPYIPSAPIGSVVVPTVGFEPNVGESKPAPDAVAKAESALEKVFPGATPVPITALACVPGAMCGVSAVTPPDRRCPYEPGPGLTAAQIRQARADPRCDRDNSLSSDGVLGQVVTDDPSLVSAVTGLHGAALDTAVATLRAGGALVGDPSYVEHGRALLSLRMLYSTDDPTPAVPGLAPGTPPEDLDIRVPAVAVPAGAPMPILSPQLLSSPALRAAKPDIEVQEVVARPAAPPTVARMDQLRAEVVGIPTDPQASPIDPHVESLPPPPQTSSLPLIMAIAAGVLALGAAAIATGLAAADSRTDLLTLAAVGATPRVRRSLSLAQSGVISGLGAVLGAVAGFGAAAAVLTGINRQYAGRWPAPDPLPIVVPWTNLLISLVVVPAVAMLGAGLLTRSRLPSERRAS